jgi:chemotaxis protein MotB
MRRKRRSEEAVHHDRWLISYADFMTLLFALFVVLFASSQQKRDTIDQVSSAIKGGFQKLGTMSDSNNAQENAPTGMERLRGLFKQPETKAPEPSTVPQKSGIDTVELQRKLNKALGKEIARQEVVMQETPEGFVVSLRELGFFNSGEARLLPGASDKIKRIATVLTSYGLDLRVEGHSDNIPIHNAAFASNWELSTARAMAVAMMLINDAGFDPKRMSIAGYGQYHPAASDDTPEGRRANRRVDLVVVSPNKTQPANAP